MTAPWRPDDAELDAVARGLPGEEPAGRQAEETRTALLASAAGRAQLSRRSARPIVVAALACAAVAAGVVAWVIARPAGRGAVAERARIVPVGAAAFDRVAGWPDFAVRLDDGEIAVEVAGIRASEEVRIVAGDGEVVTTGDGRFDATARGGRLAAVAVQAGQVRVSVRDQQVVMLAAGQSWPVVATAERGEVVEPEPEPERQPEPQREPERQRQPESERQRQPQPERQPQPQREPETKPAPGEAEFRAGWSALRGGDAPGAAQHFAVACDRALHDALGEDACFWAGAAAQRAGQAPAARAALERFLAAFPHSARAGEAAALLGWILYDAGDVAAAARQFHAAQHDRVPEVRDSAARGLAAIARRK